MRTFDRTYTLLPSSRYKRKDRNDWGRMDPGIDDVVALPDCIPQLLHAYRKKPMYIMRMSTTTTTTTIKIMLYNIHHDYNSKDNHIVNFYTG